MKNKKKKKKSAGSRSFGVFIKVYALILAVGIIIVCAVLWNSLKKYQGRYDAADDKANQDL